MTDKAKPSAMDEHLRDPNGYESSGSGANEERAADEDGPRRTADSATGAEAGDEVLVANVGNTYGQRGGRLYGPFGPDGGKMPLALAQSLGFADARGKVHEAHKPRTKSETKAADKAAASGESTPAPHVLANAATGLTDEQARERAAAMNVAGGGTPAQPDHVAVEVIEGRDPRADHADAVARAADNPAPNAQAAAAAAAAAQANTTHGTSGTSATPATPAKGAPNPK